ncbi:PREDICTED: homocysteine-responsive endoplasmic reticulum-resident ubiquitin-like domain member 2 protein [Polistes dominula]|uniref:Homocysteine-responsive endoplasmic reticulum-resident ubiquitin-like domain member 2 protein n=1 Tax=Polistes dominula TaxID=743375 RepID=A0ABM1IHD3_POLDO|nr:PREDICTED: homocysteine-responsive endoplasmic reticulum-resident ubiquitin-like domain member 2 protein [Polistes dominula]
MMMESDTVKLIIKAPNQQIKDQLIKCDIGWSIGHLKEYLSEVYPSKPESADQKLIYAGQLLNDSSCLKDILRQCDGLEDQAYIIHLVCTSQKMCANKVSDRTQTSESVNVVNSAIRNNVDHISPSQNQSTNNIITQPPPTQLYSMQQYFDPRNSQQVAWMQQAYTHYFTQYMQLMAAQGIQLPTTIPYVQQMDIDPNEVTQNTYTNNNNNNNNNNNVGDEQQPQVAVQDVADINAGNNVAGEDGAFNPDWLDFFYMLSRIIVLFSIVYFYSSPLRFLIVTFLGFVIYLYQSGFFRVQAIILPENNLRPDNNNQVLQNEGAAPQIVPAQQHGQVPTVQPEARTNANDENEERPGALAFTWTFFSSFFASLIPDQPNVI